MKETREMVQFLKELFDTDRQSKRYDKIALENDYVHYLMKNYAKTPNLKPPRSREFRRYLPEVLQRYVKHQNVF